MTQALFLWTMAVPLTRSPSPKGSALVLSPQAGRGEGIQWLDVFLREAIPAVWGGVRLLAMEHGHDNIAIDSPAVIKARGEGLRQCLRNKTAELVAAAAALEPPSDVAGIERMAKVMAALEKLVAQLFDGGEAKAHEEEMMDDDEPAGGLDAFDAWRILLDRKLEQMARRDRNPGGEVVVEDGALEPEDGLARYSGSRTDST